MLAGFHYLPELLTQARQMDFSYFANFQTATMLFYKLLSDISSTRNQTLPSSSHSKNLSSRVSFLFIKNYLLSKNMRQRLNKSQVVHYQIKLLTEYKHIIKPQPSSKYLANYVKHLPQRSICCLQILCNTIIFLLSKKLNSTKNSKQREYNLSFTNKLQLRTTRRE